MKLNDIVKYFGSQSAAARALGLDRSTVCIWQARGGIPWERQCVIELQTKGALKATPRPKLLT